MSLALLILLSLMPCSDELEINGFVKNTVFTTPHESDNCKTEECSTVCICKCCGQSLVEINISVMTVEPVVNSLAKQADNPQFLLLQRSNNIWHPPKVV